MSELFTPYKIGPIELRNRTIRSAAFEAMCPGQRPSKELFDYHTAVARGGIGMTTVAYAAVCQSGLSFENQLWMREEIVPELKKLQMPSTQKAQRHQSSSVTAETCHTGPSAAACRTEQAVDSTSTLLLLFRR